MSEPGPSNRSPLRVTGWLVVAALIAFRLLPGLVRPGMFFDGVTHAAIARNMAAGTGDFWHPVFSPSDGTGYHEQPPLGFWLESLLFRALGDHFWVEKLYSALAGLATAAVICAIWRCLAPEPAELRNCDWLPVALWATIPGWGWMYGNNMLENTLGLFTALAVYAIVRASDGGRAAPAWIVTGAAAIAGAVLSKGPVGLFPLATPLVIHFALRRQSLARAVAHEVALVLLVAAAAGLILFMPGSADYLSKYLHEQLLASLAGRREVVASALGRLDIIWKIIRELALPAAIAGGLIVAARRRGFHRSDPSGTARRPFPTPVGNGLRAVPENHADPRAIAFCLLTAASASLPIIASPKQSGHYAFPSYAFYALAIALWSAPAVVHLFSGRIFASRSVRVSPRALAAHLAPQRGLKPTPRGHQVLRFAAVIVLVALGAASCGLAGRPQREKQVYDDTIVLGRLLPRGSVVGLSDELSSDYPLQTNLTRWDFIGADRAAARHEFLVTPINVASATGYDEVPAELSSYRLFRRTMATADKRR